MKGLRVPRTGLDTQPFHYLSETEGTYNGHGHELPPPKGIFSHALICEATQGPLYASQ